MSFTAEGTIEIDLAEFFTWVYENYVPSTYAEFKYGVPRANKSNKTLEIDFAMATDCDPGDWVEKPDAVKQWKDI
jgi:hypothetical protein